MRYRGKGNPLAVFVACMTLGWLPAILLIMGIVWIVQAIPIWVWILLVFLGVCYLFANEFEEDKKYD